MELNLPIYEKLADAKNVLIAGMGGGFDIFCGLPIYFALQARGYNVHLANYSFSTIADWAARGKGEIMSKTMIGVHAGIEGTFVYFPELYLSRWFKEARGEDVTVWSFHKTGVRPLLENYHLLIDHLNIDALILMDGGVDSLMRGDEEQTGTLVEDSASLICAEEMKHVPVRLIACLGFGAELHMAYAHIMENIAALTRLGANFGMCSLLSQMPVYQAYEQAVLYTQQQPYQDPSVINSSVISAVQGHYGDFHLTPKTHGSRLWISPLMSIYWFFDLPTVARRNLLAPKLRYTDTAIEMFRVATQVLSHTGKRKSGSMPI